VSCHKFFTENVLASKAASAVFLLTVSHSRDSSNSLIFPLNCTTLDSLISSFVLSFLMPSHSVKSSNDVFMYEIGYFRFADFRSAGSLLCVFSCTKQNFVGIDPSFKLTCEGPRLLLEQSASKWSPHSFIASLTGVFVEFL